MPTSHFMTHLTNKETIKCHRKEMGLSVTRALSVTWEELEPSYAVLRKKFQNMGARGMVTKLRQEHEIKIPIFKVVDTNDIAHRKHKRFWAGVLDILCFDQPWKDILHIWWMNHNSKLVTSYYINSCHPIGVTRQHLDPSLEGTLRHCCMDKKSMNVKPEAAWIYDILNPLQPFCFKSSLMPGSKPLTRPLKADKHKILPQSLPDTITSKPNQFGTTNYKNNSDVTLLGLIPPELFDEMEATWATPSDPVFKLVLDTFDHQVSAFYIKLGSLEVLLDSFG
ncbi:hypothetical protein B0H14DRAFT_2618502 [Mycena olivaceomarginata]|nr:hypothetical protein B0H14DRAFT_2618502 [Mycena olivaceomarginata]